MDKIDNALIKHMEDKGCDGMDGIRIRTKEEEQGYIHQLQQGCNGTGASDMPPVNHSRLCTCEEDPHVTCIVHPKRGFESKPSDRNEYNDEMIEAEFGYVKKPSDRQVGGEHYKDYPIEPGEYNQKNKIGYMEGTAIKYITRHASKGGVEDLNKAIHCLELVLQWEYNVYGK